jgi:glycine oxidase
MNRTKTVNADVVIVGGGVIGLLSARELASAGARVVLLEKRLLGRESSWAGGGILSPLYPWRTPDPITRLCAWSQAVYPKLAQELSVSSGIDPEWRQSGLLFAECEDLAEALEWCGKRGVACEFPVVHDIERIAPKLGIAPERPVYLPGVAQVRNPRLLRALRIDLEQRGVVLLENHPVDEIKTKDGRVTGIATPEGAFAAGCYVVAAGAWSGRLAAALDNRDLGIAPVKGQMLVYKADPDWLRCMVLHQGRYLIPRLDGRILVGSTVEYAEFDKSVSESVRRDLESFAHALLPALKALTPEKHWAGLRPGSPEGIPRIGAHPGFSNLYFNCGHFRNGFVMAPASARLLADQILRRPAILPLEPYQISA